MRQPQRTLKRVTDFSTGRTISSDDLLAADADYYQQLRRTAVAARREGRAAYGCEECGHGAYPPRDRNRRPLWRHNKGAPRDCPWWTGDPATVDQASARQFQGAQESELHRWLKHEVADALRRDPKTFPDTIAIDSYTINDGARRRPDVRAAWGDRVLAVEIQLSTTQLPIIDAREDFYRREGRNLIWVTWNFQSPAQLPTSFEDIYYSHHKNLFSVDAEVLAQTEQEGRFLLRVFWKEEGDLWQSKIVSLDDLAWDDSGLPYAVEIKSWRDRFFSDWGAGTDENGTTREVRKALFYDLIDRLDMDGIEETAELLDELDVASVINLTLSLRVGRPIASKQSNLSEMLNTFLEREHRYPYAQLVRRIVDATDTSELLAKPSTRAKYARAIEYAQDGQKSVIGRIMLALFPDLLARS